MELRLQTTLTTWLRLPVSLHILRERQIFKRDGLTQLIALIYVAQWTGDNDVPDSMSIWWFSVKIWL